MSDTESRVLDTIAAINLAALEQVTGLDPQTVVLVPFAALVVLDAAPLSYLTNPPTGQHAELQPQVQAVQDGVAEGETAVANLDSGGAAAAVTAVAELATS